MLPLNRKPRPVNGSMPYWRRPAGTTASGLLIFKNPYSDWLLGKLQRNAHHRAHARIRALLLFQLRDALFSAPWSQSALCPFGAPLWG